MKFPGNLLRMDVILTIAGAIAGWAISHIYYLKSLNDFKADAEEKKRIDELVLRGIESIGTIKYSRDSSGKITGVIIELAGTARGSASASGTLTDAP